MGEPCGHIGDSVSRGLPQRYGTAEATVTRASWASGVIWQPRWVQDPVSERTCEFESRLAYYSIKEE